MKILYGVQGTGNGHITRARAMVSAFRNHPDTQVDFLFSGRERNKYFDMEPFGQWQSYGGLTFLHKSGKVAPFATLKHNSISRLLCDIRNLDVSQYDLIITDFEPITAWAGKWAQKTVIGVGHQYAFHHAIPKKGDNWLAEAIMRHFATVNLGIGLHWHHFGAPILPPIADTPPQTNGVIENKILVYLGFEDPAKVQAMLEPISGYQFTYYGEFEAAKAEGNIQYRPLSREGFKQDLATANGVICNAGFELASEALDLGKKLLVKPLYGQMEQLSNAEALAQLGLGKVMNTLSTDAVQEWLENQPNVTMHYPNVAGAIVNWIHQGVWTEESLTDLASELWGEVRTNHGEDFAQLQRLEEFKLKAFGS
ncbi:MJ1255/VC2487 family glycosyltransferase [Halioxenophilus sp. WMMB6]|uniref:MJ1255/VC2487 family glycosyltransferase n=1 Tax=Halioxenophilus sp. WMMB6 TaxID=3073815 RepID=UPI00295E7217|nr:MJ1255/VC2487 family glycosyltransferase [Halioxenophilus sp. WMMB6]